ncbi:MAG: ankyrin repeat domain-containing protein [Bryobacterales bacterium]|nr:ankyrin repeat domain-containing protein [Bryobacterales bacterium]
MAASADDPNAVDGIGATALHRAADQGSVHNIHRLLVNGADINARDDDGATPLHAAVLSEESEAVERLLQGPCDLNARDNYGDTPLHYAAGASNPELTRRLLQAGGSPHIRNENGATPIHAVTSHPTHIGRSQTSIDTVDRLLESGAYLNAQDNAGNTALHFLAEGRIADAAQLTDALLERGASMGLVNAEGHTALETAAADRNGVEAEYARVVREVFDQYQSQIHEFTQPVSLEQEHDDHEIGAQFDSVKERFAGEEIDHFSEDEPGRETHLHRSAAAGEPDQVDRLLKQGVDPNELDENHRSPLHEAVDSRSYETVDRLLSGGAKPDQQEALLGQTPLHRAAERLETEIMDRLLQSGANPNLRDAMGDTPLHAVLRTDVREEDQLTAVNSLIAHGARLDLPDRQTEATPLHLAVTNDKPDIASRLLDVTATPDTRDVNGATPLHLAASFQSPKATDRLLNAGANPNCISKDGMTPLHISTFCGAHENTERLIQGGANVHTQDQHGSTPLHNAATANCTKSIDHLLQAGADPRAHVPDKLGTPLETAQDFGNADAAARLTQAEIARDTAARSIGQRLFRHVADRIPLRKDDQQSRTTINPDSYHHRKENDMPKEHWINSKSARQFTEQVAKRVAGQVEKGKASFQKGFDKPKGADLQPFNPATGKRFKGLNAVQLKSTAQEKGYSDPRWMSFKTANRVGAKIKKGERGTRVEYLRFPPKNKDAQSKDAQGKSAPNGAAGGDKDKEQPQISHHTYVVFNAEQIERMPALEQQLPREPQQHEICERAERMIQDAGVKIDEPPSGQNYSNYDKERDTVELPNIEKFKTPEDYYGHAVKEMASRAGHEQQKNRSEPRSEAQQYHEVSRHEMRREMATETICAKLHLPKEPTGDKCKQQWSETLRTNPNELRYAARDADRMADKVLQHDRPQLRLQTEPSREAVAAPPTPERMQETQRALQQQHQPQRQMSPAMSR